MAARLGDVSPRERRLTRRENPRVLRERNTRRRRTRSHWSRNAGGGVNLVNSPAEKPPPISTQTYSESAWFFIKGLPRGTISTLKNCVSVRSSSTTNRQRGRASDAEKHGGRQLNNEQHTSSTPYFGDVVRSFFLFLPNARHNAFLLPVSSSTSFDFS